MANPLGKVSSSSAVKRARSQDSRRSQNASPTLPPVAKAPKTEEPDEDVGVPAFLRQSKADIYSKFHDLEWQQQVRLAEGRADSSSPWTQDNTAHAKLRNRYFNVQPWEKSRIRLRVAEGKSDYINASPISLKFPNRDVDTSYIVTQGPKQTGLNHFWQMVWHETSSTAVIVMLTQTAEAGKEKCFQYFPVNEEAAKFYVEPINIDESLPEGTIQLIETTYNEAARSTVRKLIMTLGEEDKIVWHLLFSGWPDFDVPEGEDQVALLELQKLSASKNDSTSPRIIHCSAGVGRSGTFIALEYLLARLEAGGIGEVRDDEDMIYDTVNRLREQRMTMVQSEAQYHFLYQVLLERFKRWQVDQASGIGAPTKSLGQLAEDVKSALLHVAGHETGYENGKSPERP